MKQPNLFGFVDELKEVSDKYTKKIDLPVYEPKNKKPHVLSLVDDSKTNQLVREINESDIPEEAKRFLSLAAQRHLIFDYSKVADFYAHSSKEIQQLMEKSALVIVDFKDAIKNGYLKISEDVKEMYLQEYE